MHEAGDNHFPQGRIPIFIMGAAFEKERKTSLLKHIIQEGEMTSTLVFTRTKHKAKSVALHLQKAGHSAASLQGNLSQQKLQQALNGFKDGSFKRLVATDIAARGIDVMGISHVINYDLPDTTEAYTHRSGQANSFAGPEEGRMISLIERMLGIKMRLESSPGFAGEPKEPAEERRERSSRQMPGKKRPAETGWGKRSSSGVFSLASRKPRAASR